MTGWVVTFEGRPAKPVDPEDVLEAIAHIHGVVAGDANRLSMTATVDEKDPLRAYQRVFGAAQAALGDGFEVDFIELQTEERQAQELERSNLPDLVGLAEIAELAGTTRQRVFQMTANKGFPAALLEVRSGRLWSRPAIEEYLDNRAQAGSGRLAITKKLDITKRF